MKTIDETKLIKLLPEYNNTLIMGITPWHANSIEASLLRYSLSKDNKALVACMHVENNPTIINRMNFVILNKTSAFFKYKIKQFKRKSDFLEYIENFLKFIINKSGKNEIYIYTTKEISPYIVMKIFNECRNSKIINIVSDEGLATSFSYDKLSVKMIVKKISIFLLKRKIDVIYDTLFLRNNKGIFVNKDLCARYIEVFNKYPLRINDLNVHIPEKSYILVCYGPIDEERRVENIVISKMIKKIIKIGKRYDCDVVIKTHPREKNIELFNNIGCIIWDKKISAEVFLSKLKNKPLVIIGSISTVLVTANIFFGIKTISTLYTYADSEISKYDFDCKRFANLYKNYVLFPEDYQSFEKYIEDMVINYGSNFQK